MEDSPPALVLMVNPVSSATGISTVVREVINASGGASVERELQQADSASGEPCTSISTPAGEFRTQPTRPSLLAIRKTKGRKPTPWTIPPIMKRRRIIVLPSPWSAIG